MTKYQFKIASLTDPEKCDLKQNKLIMSKTIHEAAKEGNVSALKNLICNLKVNVDSQASDKSTALHFAAFAQKDAAVRFLLESWNAIDQDEVIKAWNDLVPIDQQVTDE